MRLLRPFNAQVPRGGAGLRLTTVACNREEMAADSQVNVGNTVVGETTKVRRVRGDLVGTCGKTADGILFREWYEAGAVRGDGGAGPKLDGDFVALILRPEGVFVSHDDYVLVPVERGEYAIGSGMDFALAAMRAGETPEGAVCIACDLDSGSGPPVVSMSLQPKERS